ncbi:hypothetical protein Dvina_51490 [Dactylosporangium vinaceum]|uniref:PD(D/E)XK endonuclease domain-containing protein n=1 Tax=Dactylosporangium vinaceum TaxID=53362 RepID=A0ABV5M2L9_9ACTN|nr:hypothetical protein [Dactylosporangium vinaceum]UAB96271.1 hypothetical protein Dvina_51490 [Dactylosporangium vinaceum]
MATIQPSALTAIRSAAAEYIAALRLEAAGGDVTWRGGRTRGHDVLVTSDDGHLLVDAKLLTPTNGAARRHGYNYQVFRRGHLPWGTDGRTHLALVTLPEQRPTVAFTGAEVRFTVPVAGASTRLVPVAEMNECLQPQPLDWLWLDDTWLAERLQL